MTYSNNSIERLKLIQQHQQENNQFWNNERSERQSLILQHQQEANEEIISKTGHIARANMLRRHMCERMELTVSSNERQWRLSNRHQRELTNLIERQNTVKNSYWGNKESKLDSPH